MSVTLKFIVGIIVISLLYLALGKLRKNSTPDGGKLRESSTPNKIDELANLPTGLKVVHTPNPALATCDNKNYCTYTWFYSTTVSAIDEDIEILEFGAFDLDNDGKWIQSTTIYQRPFNSKDFADWYSCPGAIIAKGESVTDPTNWSGNDILKGNKVKWYYIGRNSKGQKVKGESTVECLAELKQ